MKRHLATRIAPPLAACAAAFTAAAFAAAAGPDAARLPGGSLVEGAATILNAERVVLTDATGASDTLAVAGLERLTLGGLGDVYTAADGWIYAPTYAARWLERRGTPAAPAAGPGFRPGDHELMLMPTAETMPAGSSYFSVYELALLNYVYAPTDNTHVGAFVLFPITSTFVQTLSLGIKQRVLRAERLEAALWASWTPRANGVTGGAVASLAAGRASYHLGAGGLYADPADDRPQQEWLAMLGARFALGRRGSLHLECATADFMQDFGGLASVGFRFRGDNICWDFGGLRPLQGSGDLLFIPVLKATWMF